MARQKGLPTPGGLSLLGEASLSGTPCLGVCSTTIGDHRCSSCGRWQKEITNWSSYSEVERKLINIRNASEGFAIRQLSDQPGYWEERRNMLNQLDEMNMGDVFKRVVMVATTQGAMEKLDHKCIETLSKIISSQHDINKVKLTSVLGPDDLELLRSRYEGPSS